MDGLTTSESSVLDAQWPPEVPPRHRGCVTSTLGSDPSRRSLVTSMVVDSSGQEMVLKRRDFSAALLNAVHRVLA